MIKLLRALLELREAIDEVSKAAHAYKLWDHIEKDFLEMQRLEQQLFDKAAEYSRVNAIRF